LQNENLLQRNCKATPITGQKISKYCFVSKMPINVFPLNGKITFFTQQNRQDSITPQDKINFLSKVIRMVLIVLTLGRQFG
jgi:hypothetical protein